MNSVLSIQGVSKIYKKAETKINVVEEISLDLQSNESIAIMGESGAGKSTLLHIMGGLQSPSAGKVFLGSSDLYALQDAQRAKLRNQHIGFVFQFHYLLPEFTALENVCMPSKIGTGAAEKQRGQKLLEEVGVGNRLDHKPGELSGGEQQRVAIARALMMKPLLLLADEPTGNLDQKTSDQVSEVLFSSMKEQGALVLVTHSEKLAQKADKVYRLTKGELVLE